MATKTTITLGGYVNTISSLLMSPRAFFSNLEDSAPIGPPAVFLVVSGLLCTVGSMISRGADRPLWISGILFVNAVGMVWIAAALGWIVMVTTVDRTVSFGKLFGVYAFSSSLTLLASWVPFFLVLTEPWKWWLIGIGLTRRFHLRWQQAAGVIGLSLFILLLLFWTAFPFTASLRNG